MSKKKLSECVSGKDFVAFALSHKAEVKNGHGSHRIIKTPKGLAVVPYHVQDLGKGLRSKLVKAFVAIGLTSLAFLWLAQL